MSDVGIEIEKAKKIMTGSEWPMTIALRTPIEFGDKTITQLVFQKGAFGILKGLDIRTGHELTIDQIQMIASRLCAQSLKVIELLDPDDADEVMAIALGFFGRCQGVGKRL